MYTEKKNKKKYSKNKWNDGAGCRNHTNLIIPKIKKRRRNDVTKKCKKPKCYSNLNAVYCDLIIYFSKKNLFQHVNFFCSLFVENWNDIISLVSFDWLLI